MLADELNNEESRGLLSAVDQMREILHDEKIRLPEIVVVGDQSVGKSSVLEAISGIQLPRAQNICTRCPLELRLKSTTDREYAIIRSGTSSDSVERTIDDLTNIALEVTRSTIEIAGDGTNVSSNPIYLTVYKRDLPYDLTLIDLPGITRNPLPGQAADIYAQIVALINGYIEPATAVVLHVIPSSVDFTTSESMKLAKEYDPHCERQLIAVSKIDKYEKGIAEKLLGQGADSMKLQLGCVAVLNRSQEEIDENISFGEMRERERQFFLKHRQAFERLPDEHKGVEQLVRKLALIQQSRIRSTLPETVEDLRNQIRSKQQELRTIPAALLTEHDCWTKFQSMINRLREDIHARVNGDYDYRMGTNRINQDDIHSLPKVTSSTVSASDDRIAYHLYKFQQKFQQTITNQFSDFFSPEYNKRVVDAIQEAAGVSLPNFPSFQIIEHLFRQELDHLPRICDGLRRDICNYMRESILKLFHQVFDKDYPRLLQRLKDIIIEEIDAAEQRAIERIKETLDMEYRLFTLSREYMTLVDALTQQKTKSLETKKIPLPTSASSSSVVDMDGRDSNEARVALNIQMALSSYCQIVQKRLIDHIAQVCYYQFITQSALIIDQKLTLAVSPVDLVRFMKEPTERSVRREKLNRTISAYEQALKLGQEYM